MITDRYIKMHHGSGGKQSQELISELFFRYFNNETLSKAGDAGILPFGKDNIVISTDSFVIDPLFFPGGDIGKLAVCGTVNDLAVSGANPLYISVAFIIEEGFELKELERIVKSLAQEAENAGVQIVCGDTKVVEKGKCDKLFINTTGVGELILDENVTEGDAIKEGDIVIVNGTIGDHGMAIMAERTALTYSDELKSDCASLNHLITNLLNETEGVKFMRDATRGGVAAVLYEAINKRGFSIELIESDLPLKLSVSGLCEMMGFDPLYVANEGKFVCIVDKASAAKVLELMKNDPLGQDAAIIGEVIKNDDELLLMKLPSNVKRIIPHPGGELLPRIC